MKSYLVWLPGRENPVEIPCDSVSWKDGTTIRFNQNLKDEDGKLILDEAGEPKFRTVAVFWQVGVCGFSWADQTAQY